MEISFKRNLGDLDRAVRALAGVTLFGIVAFRPFPLSGAWPAVLAMLGLFMLAEAALGY